MAAVKISGQPIRQAAQTILGPILNYRPFAIPSGFSIAPIDVKMRTAEQNLTDAEASIRMDSESLQLLQRYGAHAYDVLRAWQGGASPQIRAFFLNGATPVWMDDRLSLLKLYYFWYVMNYSQSLMRTPTNMILYRGQSFDSPTGLDLSKGTRVGSIIPNVLMNFTSVPSVSFSFLGQDKKDPKPCCLVRIQVPKDTKTIRLSEMGEFEYLLAGGQFTVLAIASEKTLAHFPSDAKTPFQTELQAVTTYTLAYQPGHQTLPWPKEHQAFVDQEVNKTPLQLLKHEQAILYQKRKQELEQNLHDATVVRLNSLKQLKHLK